LDSPLSSRGRTAFLIGVPLGWAVLLLFHPTGGDNFYDVVDDNVTRWQIVHIGTLAFIGLMALAVYMLVRPLPGRAAAISRVAIAVFVVFYAAFEAVAGLAVGVLTAHANGLPASEQAVVAGAIDDLTGNWIVGDPGLVVGFGSLGWIVAVVAAAFALRRAGAPRAVPWLIGLSAMTTIHPPPTGPAGLVCFAAAVVLLTRSERARAVVATGLRHPR
jgi:hypothetical protein